MAHNLNIENGEASMMYVGRVPWHGLGTQLEEPPPTAAEAIAAANLDWEVGLKRVYCMDGGIYHEIPDKKVVVRLDKWEQPDCTPFGLVGNDYQVLQNREAFAFFDPIIETGRVTYETAGALGKGERVWVLAKVEGQFKVKGIDTVERYLLLSNGHDARTALQVRFTPVRVVCQNTLIRSLEAGKDFFRMYHVPGMRNAMEEAQGRVKKLLDDLAELERTYERLAGQTVNPEQLEKYLARIFPTPKRKEGQKDSSYEAAKEKNRHVRQQAATLFEHGAGNDQEPIKGTLWAAYNGVVEMIDHRGTYADPWQRFRSVCFGEGERTKERAFEAAKAMLATPA